MGTIHSAYCLGRDTRSIEYHVRYFHRYCETWEVYQGRHIRDCLHWIMDGCTALGHAFSDPPATLILRREVENLRRILDVSNLQDLVNKKRVPSAIVDRCRLVAQAAQRCLRKCASLYPWFRLGDAIGRCGLEMFSRPKGPFIESTRRLRRASILVPNYRAREVKSVSDLAKRLPGADSIELLIIMSEAAGIELTEFKKQHPNHLLRLLELDDVLRTVLQGEVDPAILWISEQAAHEATATLDTVPYPVTYHQRKFLLNVYRRQGRIISTTELKHRHKLLAAANFSREIHELPQQIKCHIETKKGPGGGFNWKG